MYKRIFLKGIVSTLRTKFPKSLLNKRESYSEKKKILIINRLIIQNNKRMNGEYEFENEKINFF